MTRIARTALVAIALGLLGCSPHDGFDRAYGSSNPEQMSDLRLLLSKHGIPYRDTDPRSGMERFAYRSADESRVALLRRKLDRQTSVKFKEPEAREYLQRLLTEMNHDFIVSEKPDGIWIKWFPESEQQDQNVSMQVVQYMFDLQAKRASADCPPAAAAPSNSTLVPDARQKQPRAAQCGR
jgi:hypothetical protein